MPNFTKIHPPGAKLFHADRQTDRQRNRRDIPNKSLFAILETRLKAEPQVHSLCKHYTHKFAWF